MTSPPATSARYRVIVLGPFEVWRDGASLGAASWQRSVQTLLKLLATSPKRRRLRDEVVDVLWPDAPADTGASNLRYVLNLLRRQLGGGDPSPIAADRSWISLSSAYSWDIDLARFEELTAHSLGDPAAVDELVALYRAEPLIEDRYEDWAAPLRAHIQEMWHQTCRRVAGQLGDCDELEAALSWAERALASDPLDEESVRQVLDLLIRLGRRADAIKRFRHFEELLRSELDLEPQSQTREIMERARDGYAGTPARAATVPARNTSEEPPGQVLPIGAYLGTLPAAPLVARREELARLLMLVDAAGEGRRKLVLLAGEPGVGKTRLAQEVTRELHKREFIVATGRSYAPEQGVPYYPFLDVLSELARLAPRELQEIIPHRWPYLVRLLPELQGAGAILPPISVDVSGQEEPLLIRSLAGFLGAVADGQPLAVLLDDLHWSDSASIKLLLHLARHAGGSRLFVLGTYRDLEVGYDHPLHAALIDLDREGLMEKIALERLDAGATGALIAGALDGAALPPDLVEIIHRPTDGNPFFVQEVVRSLLEAGDLFQRDGRWERRPSSEIRVPGTVRSVIGQRLSRLGEDTQSVLQAGSVLGQTFRFGEVERVTGFPEERVEAALDEAARAGLVRERQPDIYAFSHALAQGAIYAEMTGRTQRRLHRVAAEAISTQPGHELRAAEIASHFLQAGDIPRAIPYLLLAGDGAEAIFAHAEAERHYRSAAEASHEIGDAGREAEALERLATTLFILSRFLDAQEYAQRAHALFKSIDDRDGERRATYRLCRVLQAQGMVREARTIAVAALELLEDTPTSSSVELYGLLAELDTELGDYEHAAEIAEKAVEMAQDLGDEVRLIRARFGRVGALWFLGRHEDLHGEDLNDTLRDYLPFAEKRNDLFLLCDLLAPLSVGLTFRGELQASKEYRERLLEVARRIGDPARIVDALGSLGASLFLLGDWQGARAHMEEAVDVSRSINSADLVSMPLTDLGHLAVCEGAWEAGERLLQEALETCQRSGRLIQMRFIHMYLANLDLLRGRPQAVIDRLTPLLDRSQDEEPLVTPLLSWLAEAYLDLGDVDRADAIVHDALRRTVVEQNRLDFVVSRFAWSRVLDRQDRLDEERALLQEVLQTAREMSFRAAEAEALWKLGLLETRARDTDAARHHLLRARELSQRLGARRDVENVDAALAKLTG